MTKQQKPKKAKRPVGRPALGNIQTKMRLAPIVRSALAEMRADFRFPTNAAVVTKLVQDYFKSKVKAATSASTPQGKVSKDNPGLDTKIAVQMEMLVNELREELAAAKESNAALRRMLEHDHNVHQQTLTELAEAHKQARDAELSNLSHREAIEDNLRWTSTLEIAIRRHRDYRGDDKCWEDDEELYKVLPEGYTPPGRDTLVELANCARFIATRQNPATEYVSPQRRIEELEAEVSRLKPYDPLTAHPCSDCGAEITGVFKICIMCGIARQQKEQVPITAEQFMADERKKIQKWTEGADFVPDAADLFGQEFGTSELPSAEFLASDEGKVQLTPDSGPGPDVTHAPTCTVCGKAATADRGNGEFACEDHDDGASMPIFAKPFIEEVVEVQREWNRLPGGLATAPAAADAPVSDDAPESSLQPDPDLSALTFAERMKLKKEGRL